MKKSVHWNTVLFAALALAGCNQAPCPPNGDNPALTITHVPVYCSTENLTGRVDGIADCSDYAVTVHVLVDTVWWGKPYADSLLTYLRPDFTFEVDITTGTGDETATEIVVCLVRTPYDPALHEPPSAPSARIRLSLTRTPLDGPEDDNCNVVTTHGAPDPSFLQDMLDGAVRSVNFAPAGFDPVVGDFPSEQDIRDNLEQLRDGECGATAFKGVLTYDVTGTLAAVPRIAREIGFKVVGVGIWDITDPEQIEQAIALAEDVDFYIVGSEGVFAGRYDENELQDAIEAVREQTSKPITTSEPWDVMLEYEELIDIVDFVTVNIYGWWEDAHEPADAVDELISLCEDVVLVAGDKAVIVRETGFPTGGHPEASAAKQLEYFRLLAETDVPFVYFEAYDQPWKHEDDDGYDIGPHWGLCDQYGNTKPADEMVDHRPVAEDQSLTTSPGAVVNVTLTATDSDGDLLTYRITTEPSAGTLSGTPPTVTYTPNSGFSGTDGFSFVANDGTSDSNTATVTILVANAPAEPAIEFTFVPLIGSDDDLQGIVTGAAPDTSRVTVYILVDGTWWVKPYAADALTTIEDDGTWVCDITTGGNDPQATAVSAFLVGVDYDALINTLPEEGDYVAWTQATR